MDVLHLKKPCLFCIGLLMLVVLSISCSENNSQKIGKNYLDSQKYSDFKTNSDREIEQKKSIDESLSVQLAQLSECSDPSRLSLPVKIDLRYLSAISDKISKDCRVESNIQTLYLLGESKFGNQIISWVLLERQTVYRDQEVLVTIFQDGELRNFKTVGIFQENPTKNIIPEIQARKSGEKIKIITRTTREIFYPIEQENIVTKAFEIGTDGNIQEL